MQGLKSSDWQKGFEACDIIKRAALHNRNTLQASLLAELSKDLVKNSESLRS